MARIVATTLVAIISSPPGRAVTRKVVERRLSA
jgi:hypothetical protein